MREKFLAMNKDDMSARGWEQLDFLLISGDAYVDHPSFGTAIIGRLLEKRGYKVGIIAQPDWRSTTDFKKMGKPRLGVLVTAGNLDSMLNKFTAAKKFRSTDSYSPGGMAGLRPERATIVYCNRIREIWKKIPLIIGGIEASLRRFAHYDYWSDSVRRSILVDCRADLLVYGMGEKQIEQIAEHLNNGVAVKDIRSVRGTVYRTEETTNIENHIEVLSYEQVAKDKSFFAKAFKIQYEEQDPIRGKAIVQAHGDGYIVQNPPQYPLTTAEMDEVYALPYLRTWHPDYDASGGVPAIQEVKFSLVSHRGCFGGCNFCAIVSHQGRIIQQRSHDSLITEARLLINDKDFKGYIHDVGGPTANFRHTSCDKQLTVGTCKGKQCLFPTPCRQLNTSHDDYLRLLRELRMLPKVKKVFIRSGLRFDYLIYSRDKKFMTELCEHHVSGQLKVAPEHISNNVLRLMGKSAKKEFVTFKNEFHRISAELGKEQYLVPYFMSSHPGSGLNEAIELALFLRDIGYHPEQVQDFIPTPGSLSTAMYYTGLNPLTGESVYVAKEHHEKRLQRALLQYRNPKNRLLVQEALIKAGRRDLIGFTANCLIRPISGEQMTRTGENRKFFGARSNRPTNLATNGKKSPKRRK